MNTITTVSDHGFYKNYTYNPVIEHRPIIPLNEVIIGESVINIGDINIYDQAMFHKDSVNLKEIENEMKNKIEKDLDARLKQQSYNLPNYYEAQLPSKGELEDYYETRVEKPRILEGIHQRIKEVSREYKSNANFKPLPIVINSNDKEYYEFMYGIDRMKNKSNKYIEDSEEYDPSITWVKNNF